VLTYDPHPSKVLRPESAVPLIFTRAQKDERLTEAGAQRIHHEKFDQAHAGIEAADFPRWLQRTFPHLKSLTAADARATARPSSPRARPKDSACAWSPRSASATRR